MSADGRHATNSHPLSYDAYIRAKLFDKLSPRLGLRPVIAVRDIPASIPSASCFAHSRAPFATGLTSPARLGTLSPMKARIQVSPNGRVPVLSEKRFLIHFPKCTAREKTVASG